MYVLNLVLCGLNFSSDLILYIPRQNFFNLSSKTTRHSSSVFYLLYSPRHMQYYVLTDRS